MKRHKPRRPKTTRRLRRAVGRALWELSPERLLEAARYVQRALDDQRRGFCEAASHLAKAEREAAGR